MIRSEGFCGNVRFPPVADIRVAWQSNDMKVPALPICASVLLNACATEAPPRHLTNAEFEAVQRECRAPEAYLTVFHGQRMIWFKGRAIDASARDTQAECLLRRTQNTDVVGVSYIGPPPDPR